LHRLVTILLVRVVEERERLEQPWLAGHAEDGVALLPLPEVRLVLEAVDGRRHPGVPLTAPAGASAGRALHCAARPLRRGRTTAPVALSARGEHLGATVVSVSWDQIKH